MNCELGWPFYKIFITSRLPDTQHPSSAWTTATKAHGRPTQAHEGPQHPTTTNEGQRRSTAAHGRPTQAHSAQRRPTQVNAGPRKPTAPDDGQRRPTQAHSSSRKANTGPRRPTAPNDGTRRPTKATKANTGLAALAQANVHRFFFSFTHCTIVFVY